MIGPVPIDPDDRRVWITFWLCVIAVASLFIVGAILEYLRPPRPAQAPAPALRRERA